MTDFPKITKKTAKKFGRIVNGRNTNDAPSVQFFESGAGTTEPSNGVGDIANMIRAKYGKPLTKSVTASKINRHVKEKYDSNKVVHSSQAYQQSHDGIEEKGWQRVSDRELKEISQVDPYISSIISTRAAQGSVVGRESESKFDKGTRVSDLNPLKRKDFGSSDEFETANNHRAAQMKEILGWMMNCGTKNTEILDTVFAGSDKTFKYCSLSEFISSQARNLLTFGRMGTQIFRNEHGMPIMFRPVPIETIKNVSSKKNTSVPHLTPGDDTIQQSFEDLAEYKNMSKEERPTAYIQEVEGQQIAFFTDRDLRVDYLQKQALFDLRGYPLAPIELAIYMVFVHQNTLGYLRNQLVKGMATKGILSLESSDASAELGDEDLDTLRKNFHNFVNRNDNSAAVPVIAGPVKVSWIPLSTTPKDMEFLQVEEHVVRALCAAFQTSPQEMGYGHLSMNQGGLTQGNKQEEIIHGEERGLRMLLDVIYDCLNDILYENFPKAEETYKVTYVGVGEDTKDTVINRNLQELNTTATMNSLYSDSEKKESVPIGGDIPLNQLYHSQILAKCKYGEYRELFMGDVGASKRPEYDFIIDPALDQAYQARLMNSSGMLREQGQLQLEQMEAQTQQIGAESQQMMAQPQQQEEAPQGGDGEQPQDEVPEEEQQPEEVEKSQSLLELFQSGNLAKSRPSYFSEWVFSQSESLTQK